MTNGTPTPPAKAPEGPSLLTKVWKRTKDTAARVWHWFAKPTVQVGLCAFMAIGSISAIATAAPAVAATAITLTIWTLLLGMTIGQFFLPANGRRLASVQTSRR